MNVMKLVTSFVTPVLAKKVAGMFGIPEGIASKVLSLGVPLVLGGLLKRSKEPGGQEAFENAYNQMDGNPLDKLTEVLNGGKEQATVAAGAGSDVLGSIFGSNNSGALASKLAGYVGTDEKTAGPLMGLAGAMAMGSLKKAGSDNGLDAAGVLEMLGQQKDEIAGALPNDLIASFGDSGLLGNLGQGAGSAVDAAASAAGAAAGAVKSAAGSAADAAADVAPKKGGIPKWLLILIAALLLFWLVPKFFGGGEEPAPVEVPAAVEESAAEEEAGAVEEAAGEAADAVSALVAGEVDVGKSFEDTIGNITGILSSVTDTATAEVAAESLTAAEEGLSGLEDAAASLGDEGKTALQALVASTMPAVQATADKLLEDTGIAGILKPVVDSLMEKLYALGG